MASAGHPQTSYAAPPGAVEILLVRHGASAPFVPGVPFDLVDGQGDPPLAPEGVQQAKLVGERLSMEKIDAVYVTTMRRTRETAEPLLAANGLEPIVEPDLREVHLGEWEGGLLRQRAAEGHPTYLAMHTKQDWSVIPGAESVHALQSRCVAAIERIWAAHRDQRVAVFVHGGVIGVLCAWATESRPFAFNGANNGSIHHLVLSEQDGWKLRCFNDTSHLGPFSGSAEAMT